MLIGIDNRSSFFFRGMDFGVDTRISRLGSVSTRPQMHRKEYHPLAKDGWASLLMALTSQEASMVDLKSDSQAMLPRCNLLLLMRDCWAIASTIPADKPLQAHAVNAETLRCAYDLAQSRR